MNILFCYKNWLNPNRGGVGRVADTLARYFTSQAVNVFYLVHEQVKDDTYNFPADIYILPDAEFNSEANKKKYHELLRSLDINVIINHDASNDRSKFWLDTGRYPVKKISLYHTDPLHGLNHKSEELNGARKLLYRYFPGIVYIIKKGRRKHEINYLLEYSDFIVLLSNTFKTEIEQSLGIKSRKIIPISNSIHFEDSGPDEMAKKKRVLFVGRIEWDVKRPDKMLLIWADIYTRHPEWELFILGDGKDRARMEEMAKKLNLKSIRFLGFVDPVPYYKEASIICMTSDYEGFGLVVAEAMNFGLVPCAYNNWPSLSDIILNGSTGFAISNNNHHEYVKALDNLMVDETLLKKMSIAARSHVQKFKIDVIGPNWIKLLNDN